MCTSAQVAPTNSTTTAAGRRRAAGRPSEPTSLAAKKPTTTSFATSPSVRPNAKGSRSRRWVGTEYTSGDCMEIQALLLQRRLAGGTRDEVDQLLGAPDKGEAEERRPDPVLRASHGALVVADHAEIHEARGGHRHGSDQGGNLDGGIEDRGEERGEPTNVHEELQFPRTARAGRPMSRSLSTSPLARNATARAAGSSGSRQRHLPAQKGLWIDQTAARIGRWLRIAVDVSRDLEVDMRKALAAGGAEDANRCGGVYALSDRDQHRIVVEVAVVELIPRVPDDDPVAPEWVAGKGGPHTGVEGQEGLATTVVGRTDDDQVNAAMEWDRRVECGRAVGLLEAERNPPRVAADLAWHRPTNTCAHAQGEAQHARDVGVVWIVRDAWRVVVVEDRTLERVQRR